MHKRQLSNIWMTRNIKLASSDFLSLYSDSLHKYYRDKDLFIDYPNIKDVFKTYFTESQLKVMKKLEFNTNSIKDIKLGQMVFTLCKNTKRLSVLRHLRNAIAHSSILKVGTNIIIRDFYEDDKINYSCYGVISKACFKSLISI